MEEKHVLPLEKDVSHGSLPQEQVEYMERLLTRHYGCRVTSVERYCDGFRAWQSAIEDKVKRMEAKEERYYAWPVQRQEDWSDEEYEKWVKYYEEEEQREIDRWKAVLEALKLLYLPIYKSCLLNRLIYMGETLRSKQCPIHKGRWSGYAWGQSECECSLGSADITGWLPEDELDLGQKIALYCRDKGLNRAEYWHIMPASPEYEEGKANKASAAGYTVFAATMDEAIEQLAEKLSAMGFDPSKY